MSIEETKARVRIALRAMMAIGFSVDKVMPVLIELIKLSGQNWAYIEKDSYRALVHAIFQRDKAEAVEHSKRKRQPTEMLGSEVRSVACEKMSVRRQDWFLEYMKVVTPDQKKIESMPSSVTEASLVPIRAWNPQIELMTEDMGLTEKIQFGTATLGVGLGCLVKAVHETAQLEERHKVLLEEHRTCPSLIKSLEVKVAEERKHAVLIEAEISRKDKEIDELKKRIEAQEARWRNEFERAEVRMKVIQAETGFRKSDTFKEFVNCTYVYSCGEILKMFKGDESVANMEAYIEMKKKEFGLVPTDIDDDEGDMRRTKMPRPSAETWFPLFLSCTLS